MPKTEGRSGFWAKFSAVTLLWLGLVIVALGTAVPAMADMIRFGYGGSIHGGAVWEIRPDDSVRFVAYQADAAVTQHPNWVWDTRSSRSGHITFAVPGAFARASAIVMRRVAKAQLGPAPAYASTCTDAGHFSVEVDISDLTYTAMVDACIISTTDKVPKRVLRHYRALKAATDEITGALQLDRLL